MIDSRRNVGESRNFGYCENEFHDYQSRGNFRSQDCLLEGYRRRLQTQMVRNREQYNASSLMYADADYIERNLPEPDYDDDECSLNIGNREYRENRLSIDPYIRQNEIREPKPMAIGYMDRRNVGELRNFGYCENEFHDYQFRGNFRSQDCLLEGYRRRLQTQMVRNREQYNASSLMYDDADYIERNLPEPDYDDDECSLEIGKREYRENILSVDPYIRQNEIREPKPMAIGYMDRGYLPRTDPNSTPSETMITDRRTEISNEDIQFQQIGTTSNNSAPFTVQNYPQTQMHTTEKKDQKPRKVWWYTTSRVFSALLIICSLVSDWLQAKGLNDPINDAQDTIKDLFLRKICTETTGEKDQNAAKQFLYFTIAGTVLAVGQLVNIIYQIVQNHRLPADVKIPEYVDERTEVFFVNVFVEIPQSIILCRLEKNTPDHCLECGITINSKKFWRFLNGLVPLASSFWRFLTHVNFSSDSSKCSCSGMCKKCTQRIKDCFLGCIKCWCPCCFCYIE
ncbi:uncharacterized protein LOC144626574 [Crassostrea virginica]